MTKLQRLKLLFALLYFVQGGAISYFMLFQKPYLHSVFVPTERIALISTIMILPFILKIIFGHLSDKLPYTKYGKRRPLMIAGLGMACIAFFLCGLFPASYSLILYSCAVILASFCVAFFDAATDGLAMDTVPENEQGSVQSYMVGGKAFGVIVLSLLIGQVVQWRGYSYVFYSLAAIFLIPLIFSWQIKESPIDKNRKSNGLINKIDWSQIPYISLTLFAITYSIISFGSDGLITLYLTKVYSLTGKNIGHYGSLRGVGAIVGSLSAGFLLARHTLKKIHFLSLIILSIGVWGLGTFLNRESYLYIAVIWGSLWGLQEVCFLTLVMNKLKNTQSAFAFSTIMAMGNLGTAIGEGLSTRLTVDFSFPQVFTILAIFGLTPLFFLMKIQGTFTKD